MSDFQFKTQNATLRELAQCKALLLEQSKQIETLRQEIKQLVAGVTLSGIELLHKVGVSGNEAEQSFKGVA